MQALAKKGAIEPLTLIMRGAESEWVREETVKGFDFGKSESEIPVQSTAKNVLPSNIPESVVNGVGPPEIIRPAPTLGATDSKTGIPRKCFWELSRLHFRSRFMKVPSYRRHTSGHGC